MPDGKVFAAKFLRIRDSEKTEGLDAKKLKSKTAFKKEIRIMKQHASTSTIGIMHRDIKCFA